MGAGEHSVSLIAELDRGEDLGGSPLSAVDTGPLADSEGRLQHGPVDEQFLHSDFTGEDGPSPGLMQGGPRIGLVAQLRRITTRVPREVRVHGFDG